MFGHLGNRATTLNDSTHCLTRITIAAGGQAVNVAQKSTTNWPFPKTLPPGLHDKVRLPKPDLSDMEPGLF
jgi:hypothetical protein